MHGKSEPEGLGFLSLGAPADDAAPEILAICGNSVAVKLHHVRIVAAAEKNCHPAFHPGRVVLQISYVTQFPGRMAKYVRLTLHSTIPIPSI